MGSDGDDIRARLTRVVRHDLRGAMNVLQLNLELLTTADDRVTAAHRAERASPIRTACDAVCSLLPLAVDPLPPDEDAAVASIVARLQPLFSVRGVTVADASNRTALATQTGEASARLVGVLLDVLEASPRGSTIEIAYDPAGRRLLVSSSAGAAGALSLSRR